MKKILYLSLMLLGIFIAGCSKKNLEKPADAITQKNGNDSRLTVLDVQDPFSTYLTSVPTIFTTISTTNSGSGSSAITTKRFTFKSRGGVNTVFAIMAYPQQTGTYPAVMCLHGGGSNAEGMLGQIQSLAATGYVTISIDQPGICGTGNTPNSSGPWKSKPAGEGPRFDVSSGAQGSTLADAGIANLEAFNFLGAQSNVNTAKMGILGTSWGGYSTTLLSGLLGTRIVAAYAQFGCGYYDKGSFWTNIINGLSAADKNVWLTYLDAGRRAPNLKAAYFNESPSNDTYFWPEAIKSTQDAITGTKNLVITPNLNHTATASSGTMKQLYFDYYLKGTGSAFGKVTITGTTTQGDGSLKVTVNVAMPSGITATSVQLYYSEPTATWQTRTWIGVNATLVSGTSYSAVIPATSVTKNADFYGYAQDSRTVVVSSYMQKTLGGSATIADGTYKIVNRNSGLALDAQGQLTANGTPIQQWTYSGGNNQRWTVTSLGGGQYKIIGVQSGRSLDVTGQLTADGTAVQLYDYKAGDNQKWVITPTSGGYYSILGVQSGKPIEVVGNTITPGALIDIYTSNGGNHQQWAFQAP
jgi:dienelactone hydrolase